MTDWVQIIRDLMAEKRMSHRRLAISSGVSRGTLRRFFEGTSHLRTDALERLLLTLGYEIDIFKMDVRKR